MEKTATLVCAIGLAITCLTYGNSSGESGSLTTTHPAATSAGTETKPNETVGGLSSFHASENKSNEDCFCTYEYEDEYVEALIRRKTLKVGDTIRRGERVTFKCKSFGMVLTWQNGLRLSDDVRMICNICKKWQRNDVPICKKFEESEALISFFGHSHIYPGGIAIVERGVESWFYCYNSERHPEWDYGQRKAVSVIKNRDIQNYYVSLLIIQKKEIDLSGIYECYMNDDSGQRQGSTFLHLQVKEIYCEVPADPPNGRVRYSSLKYGTELKYKCNFGYLLKQHQPRICSLEGNWSNEEPECIETTCEEPQPPKFGAVKLHGDLKVGSLATYSCDPDRKLHGENTTKCLISGQWTFGAPECIRSCKVPFIENGELGTYETPHSRTETYAAFTKVPAGENVESQQTLALRCKSGYTAVDNSDGILGSDPVEVKCSEGAWSRDLHCKPNQKCSIHDLSVSVPENVQLDMSKVTEEYVTLGFEIKLKCANMSIITGDSKALCEKEGRWKFGNFQCILGCVINLNPSSHLLVEPKKEVYRFGELITLSCPPGEKSSSDVERVMCFPGFWSDPLPNCIELGEKFGN